MYEVKLMFNEHKIEMLESGTISLDDSVVRRIDIVYLLLLINVIVVFLFISFLFLFFTNHVF